jgi:hypothetical protein
MLFAGAEGRSSFAIVEGLGVVSEGPDWEEEGMG